MKEIGLYEAKTRLSAIVRGVCRTGEAVALTRHGRVVAEIYPPSRKIPKRGCLSSKGFYMAADFDAEGPGFEDFLGDLDALPEGTGTDSGPTRG